MFLLTTSAVIRATTHRIGTWIATNHNVLNMPVQKLNPALVQVFGSNILTQLNSSL